MTQHDVLKEFYATPSPPGSATDRMAEEIVRLREENDTLHSQMLSGNLEDRSIIHQLRDVNLRHQEVNDRLRAILAMLRKPDLDVLAAAMTAWSRTGDVPAMLHAALTTAEREVTNDEG